MEGIITNSETVDVLSNAKVTLFDENFKELQIAQSHDKGNYSFTVECNKKYYVRGEKEEYETKQATVKTPNKPGKTTLPLATAKKIREIEIRTN